MLKLSTALGPSERQRLTELAADIRQQGLLNPIVLHENKVLDGREWLFDEACRADREHWFAQAALPYEMLERLSAIDEGEIKRRLKGRAWKEAA